MVRDPESAKTGRIGVAHVHLAVVDELGWLFREQPKDDYGIDAHVEVVDAGAVIPRLLAFQVKAGQSWFSEPGPGGWWFRPTAEHVRYWTSHSLPVVVALYNPVTKICYWQIAASTTLERSSGDGWKLLVPEDHILDESARAPLRKAAEADPYVLRIRELQLARPWMQMLRNGQRLVVDVEEWINKTLGRGSITLGVDEESGGDPTPLANWGVFLGMASYEEVLPRLFAWAQIDVHQETYDEADYQHYEAECVIYDNEGDRLVTETYHAWQVARRLPRLRPYANAANEVDYWRLELALNDLGNAFLLVDDFALSGDQQVTP